MVRRRARAGARGWGGGGEWGEEKGTVVQRWHSRRGRT